MTPSQQYGAQIAAQEYSGHSYRKQERWDSFWHQLELVGGSGASTVLEIGPGPGIVTGVLRQWGHAVTTVDIADDVGADVVASVTELPFADNAFDLVLASEILEHIAAEDVPRALAEIARVARSGAVISVPTPGMSFRFDIKVPLVPRVHGFWKIPFFWKMHRFDGQHYWELGTKGRSLRWFSGCINGAGLAIALHRIYPDAPYHHFFVLAKKDTAS